jgi:hypothetical protein
MEEKSELPVNEIFPSLSDEGKRLLISMCHPAETGVKKEAIMAFSEVEEEKLDPAMKELTERGLLESGKLEEGEFVVGEGNRYRLPPKVKEQVL